MEIQEQIQNLLDQIEKEQKVKIILAIESGSRAWGFPSKDSDYDIRFIYHHERDWYLSAFEQRDVIDTVFIGDLDAGGWGLRKCLQLLYKGNAPLYEWLNSPVVYRQDEDKLSMLQHLATGAFNPKVAFHHYLSLAKKKLLHKKSANNAKSFLYALRALLCARWIAEKGGVPPVDFSILQRRYLNAGVISDQLMELITDKQLLVETDEYEIPSELMSFANSEFSELMDKEVVVSKISDTEIYDEVLRGILRK